MGLKKNFIYSFILVFSGYIFPLITYPYVSRVLGVNNIGICNFVDSIINYFILFSTLGLTTIGIREVAKYKTNREELNKVFSSIIVFNLILTILAILVLVILVLYIDKFSQYKELLFFGVFKIIFNFLLIEWFYRGIENFKYITIRSLTVQAIYVISIFVFVRNRNDFDIYYLLSVCLIVINSVINWKFKNTFVSFSFKNISLKKLYKPVFTLGFYRILTSMYTTLNVAFLGFVANNVQVGYYTTSTKLYTILIAVFSAFTSVMLPRMSSLVSENKIDELKYYTNKSFDLLYSFSLPLIFFSIILAPQIILVLSGKGYEGAILPFRIIMPLILIIGLEQILVVQILIPLKKDKAILLNSIFGALTGILLNLLLVTKFQSVGTALVWIFSELAVFISALYFVNKYLKIKLLVKRILKNIFIALPIIIIAFLSLKLFIKPFVILVFAGLLSAMYIYIVQTYYMKNAYLLQINEKIKKIIKYER